MKLKTLKKLKLPDKPGVYLFLKNGKILYIGKATSLKDRVKSYFGRDLIGTRGPIILDMVFKADKIDWQETDSVLEALILEANLIKKHQPKYNTKEKSDKSFNYVCITKEKLPKVTIARGKELQGQQNFSRSSLPRVRGGAHTNKNFVALSAYVFGPFPNSTQLREALKIVRKIFPFLDDKSKNYIEFYRQINLIPDLNDTKLYKQNIKNIILFFSAKKQQIFRNLKKEMIAYAKSREFEKAGEIKRQLFALQHINDVALIRDENITRGNAFTQSLGPSLRSATPSQKHFLAPFRIEAYDIAHMSGKNMVGVMVVVEDGEVNKNEYRKFRIRTQNGSNDTGALKEVLERRLAHIEWNYPSLIVVDGGVAQINVAKKVLSRVHLDIPLVSVVKDERHKPKAIMGDDPRQGGASKLGLKYRKEILLANSEAHRFAIAYHKKMRTKNFLK